MPTSGFKILLRFLLFGFEILDQLWCRSWVHEIRLRPAGAFAECGPAVLQSTCITRLLGTKATRPEAVVLSTIIHHTKAGQARFRVIPVALFLQAPQYTPPA